MHPLKQLRSLLQATTPNTGKVVKVEDTLVIATRNGMLSVQQSSQDANHYSVGDTVVLNNGMIVGRRKTNNTVYVI